MYCIDISVVYHPNDLKRMAESVRVRGSTVCPGCNKSYKNNAVPPVCVSDGCNFPLGNVIIK